MLKPDAEKFGHFAITPNQLAKIAFGLTIDQVNELTMALTHAEAAVDMVRWHSDAKESLHKGLRVVGEEGDHGVAEPADLVSGTIATLLHRAVSDLGTARLLIENAARIKAVRHGDESAE
jgi:hypothetical protein